MPRYIDADEAIRLIELDALLQFGYTKRDAIDCIKATPTADVVPKSEVERLSHKCDECAGCTQWKCDCANIKLEVAREIIDDILSKIRTMIKEIEKVERCGNSYYSEFNGGSKTALEIVFKDIEELKKRYTENENG